MSMSQGLNRPPHEIARTYPETCEPNKDDVPKVRLDNLHRDLLRAPQTPTVALPKQEEEQEDSEKIFYSGSESDLGGGLVGITMDDEARAMLDYIDDIFPGLLAIQS
jgi:hypothetical protein